MDETEKSLRRGKKKLARRILSLARRVSAPAHSRPATLAIVGALRAALSETRELSLVAPQGGEQLHRARLALKRLRYMAEALRGVVPGITATWIEKLHRAQSVMGDIHDLQLFGARFEKHTARSLQERRRLRRIRKVTFSREQRLLRAYRSRLPSPPIQLRRILARSQGAADNAAA